MSPKSPSPIDAHISRRILEARLAAGLSQTAVADKLGITFQQQQKYEKGTNRVSAGRLLALAFCLRKPVEWFYEGAPVIKLRKVA